MVRKISFIVASLVLALFISAPNAQASVYYSDATTNIYLDSWNYQGEKFGKNSTQVDANIRMTDGIVRWGSQGVNNHYDYIYNEKTGVWTSVLSPNKKDVWFNFSGDKVLPTQNNVVLGGSINIQKLEPEVRLNERLEFAVDSYSLFEKGENKIYTGFGHVSLIGNFVLENVPQFNYYEEYQKGGSIGWSASGSYTVMFPNGLPVGFSVPTLEVNSVPEPASLSFAGIASIGLLARRRRR